jgi:hypothetical protein
MRPLSPIEAIAPSIARTRQVLFMPFRPGRSWKIGITGYLSFFGSAYAPFPLLYVVLFFAFVPHGMGRMYLGGMSIALLVILAIWLVLYYLLSKLGFAFFGMVLHREPMVTPMWRRYGPAALPWTLFRFLAGSVLMALIAFPLMHAIQRFAPQFAALQTQPGQPPDPRFFAAFMSMYAVIFGLYFAFGIYLWLLSVLSDFVMPSLALEGVSLREAFRRMSALFRTEPGQVTGYALMKLLLALAGVIAAMVAFYIALFMVAIAALIIFGLIGFGLHLAHVPSSVLFVMAMIIGFALYIVSAFYFMGLAMGAVNIFLEAYLQHFLGGRYPILGDLLDQSTPPPPQFAPPIYAYPPPDWTPPAA